MKNFPVIINNFNRLDYLQQQVDWLRQTGHKNLHIIDNASTYPPLLKYYKKVPATVYKLDRNVGHEALWRTHVFQRFQKYFYVLTDPDVLPDINVPADYLRYFYEILKRYPSIQKAGFGIRTNNLPDFYPKKKEVINWERELLTNEIEPGLYKAPIDTTFALYRPGASFQCWKQTLRTAAPYLLQHMPWYENPAHLSEETKYYIEHCNTSSSWYKTLAGEDKRYEA